MTSILKRKNLLLYLIFTSGILLRFYGFWNWSFTSDELSAINRVNYNSFYELVELGIKTDVHPALVQVFLYFWTSIVGKSEFAVRLPFVVAGIASLFYFYFTAKVLFNKNASLIALSIYSVTYPLVLYSQIARPYAFGVFFVLGFSYYWVKLQENNVKKWHIIAFIIFGLAGFLTHYFSALTIAILIIAGLFLIPKKRFLQYLVSVLAIGLLFLPHLTITLAHLSRGGLGWTPIPESGFIFKFIDYAFNSSIIFKSFVFCTPIIAAFIGSFQLKIKKQLPIFFYFIIPYWIAFYYSIYISPILQYSALIFSLPFLLLFISSFISKNNKSLQINLLSILILISGFITLTYSQHFYEKKPFGNFAAVSDNIVKWSKKYGSENMVIITNGNSPNYLAYYLNQHDDTVTRDIDYFDSPSKTIKAVDLIDSTTKKFVLIAFANGSVPNLIHEHAKIKFPEIVEKTRYFNSEAILYKKSNAQRKKAFETNFKAFSQNQKWQVDISKITDTIFYNHPPAFHIESNTEYALTYKDSIKNLVNDSNRFLTVSARFKSFLLNHAHLVMSVTSNGEQLAWQSIQLKDYWKPNKWVQVIDVLEIKEDYPKQAQVTIFIWNREHEEMFIDDFKIINFADSDYDYYQF